MAEKALYSNPNEPAFPFDQVREYLDWLPSHLSAFEPKDNSNSSTDFKFTALLDTVLVFGRARTAALLDASGVRESERLASRLNKVLERVGKDALRNKNSQVRRGPTQYFLTCINSHRFDWSLP